MHKPIFAKLMSWFPVAFAVLTFAGCATVGPDYVPPETSVSNHWHTRLEDGLIAQDIDPQTLRGWWTRLNDPELSSLIERAVAGNLDIKKARARVREARARRAAATADFFPTLDTAGSARWSHSAGASGSGSLDSAGSANWGGSAEGKGVDKTSSLYSTNFDASWELDIFGGVRRSAEAAEAGLRASQEDLCDVIVSLLAEVALNYVEVRTFQARLAVTAANLAVQNETHRLAVWQHQAGLSDQLSVEQATYNLENTRSQIPTLRSGMGEAMNRIAVLLGDQPGKVHDELEKPATIPVAPLKVAVGIPADVLRRRPDVRRVERELAAQTARVGVATAELYPKLTLSGSIGLEASSLNELLSSSRTFSGGPGITWAIFRGGAIRQNIEAQSALQEQALIKYEAAILSALEEVENILTAYAEEQDRRQALREGEEAARRAVEMAQQKYEAGLTNFINVMDAERSLLSFQDQLAQSDGTVASNLIKLYKALGGGWESPAFDEKE